LIDQTVHGDLFPTEPPLLGGREPGPATDELWEEFEIQQHFAITREQVIKLGKDPEKSIKYPNEVFGLGEDAYMARLDIFHILHCFNTIRQEAFKDYYFDGEKYHMEGFGPSSRKPSRKHDELWWIHLRHCTDLVTQQLMCKADATMSTLTWMETQELPFPDFSVNKKCTDFGALTRWQNENALDLEKVIAMKKPPGGDQAHISEWYWKLFGNETIEGDNVHHPLW
jgi:hypothetical protein